MRASALLLLAAVSASTLSAQKDQRTITPKAICPGCVIITATSGGGQNGKPSTTLPNRLVVRVTFAGTGQPVGPGNAIFFTVTSTPNNANGAVVFDAMGKSISDTVGLTLADSAASAQFTLGDLAGDYQVTASCFGCVSAVFTETARICPVNVSDIHLDISNKRQSMRASFTPTNGTLDFLANECNFQGFDWVQTVTALPDPSPLFTAGGIHLTEASVPFADFPEGGYNFLESQVPPFLGAWPFYYNPIYIPFDCTEKHPDQTCSIYIRPLIGNTLNFSDSPFDSCLEGGHFAFTPTCENARADSGAFLAFKTQLVGILASGQPSDPLFTWTWKDDFNGAGSGGVFDAAPLVPGTAYPVDPASGVGGITVMSINDVTLPPAVPGDHISVTASGLAFSRVSQNFIGTLTLKNLSSIAITGPFQILLFGIPNGATMTNATGDLSGTPYLTVPNANGLGPGQVITVGVQLKNPSNAVITLTPAVYSGGLN